MTNEFASGSVKKTYEDCVLIKPSTEDYTTSDTYSEMLENPDFYSIVKEIIGFGISRYKMKYSDRYMDTNFQLYQKYTYEDVCRLLDWEKGEVALNIGGYKYDK